MATVVASDVPPPNKSTQTFITALVTGLGIAGAYVVVFMLIRPHFRKIFNPRSFLVEPRKRIADLPPGLLAWIPAIVRADARQIIDKNGLDAYVFVRYLYLMLEIFFPFWLAKWAILIPVDAAGSKGNSLGIEKLTLGNVGLSQAPRYGAHACLVWLLTCQDDPLNHFYSTWVFYLINRELAAFAVLRQDFLISREHSMLPAARTVLVTGVAKEYLDVKALMRMCNILPGGVSRIWLARNMKELPDLQDRRKSACEKLESAETRLLKKAAKHIRVAATKAAKKLVSPESPFQEKRATNEATGIMSDEERPHHKLGFLGLRGEKVDTIKWARDEIALSNTLIDESRAVYTGADSYEKYPAQSAAFIAFNSQMAAHMFSQLLYHHAPLRMSSRYVEVDQEDVIWSNLTIDPIQAKIRYALSWAMTIGLLVAWTFAVAFIGLLSNVSSLCETIPWAAFLCELPTPINGVIQGLLPPAALGAIFIVLPIVLRLFARFQGIPLKTQIELSLMSRYFLFLVIHGFLVVTLASGLIAALPGITKDPTSAITLLATKLPTASTFFLTYFVTTALGGASGSLLQIVTLVIYYARMFVFGSTPRAVHKIKFELESMEWGTLFPSITLLTVIGLTYSVIAPLVSGFAFLSFGLFWFVYKYLFLWVYETPPSTETGGQFYPKAIGHIFVGLYIEQICLAGLFFLARDSEGKPSAIPAAAFMIILIVITIFFQSLMTSGYQPLFSYLPLSFAGRIEDVGREGLVEDERAATLHAVTPNLKDKMEKNEELCSFPPRRSNSDDTLMNSRQNSTGKSSTLASIDECIWEECSGSPAVLSASHRLDRHAFDHPASYEDQQIVWIPQDSHGLYENEILETSAAGVAVSSVGATMDAKGAVDAVRSPPGEDWHH